MLTDILCRLNAVKCKIISLCGALISMGGASDDLPAYAAESYNERFTEGALAPLKKAGLKLYVSGKTGGDENDGSQVKPFKTLTAARDHIRELIDGPGLPPGGIEVLVAGGNYLFSEPLSFDRRDSGTEESPIVWRGLKQGEVILSGGTPLDVRQLRKVTFPAALDLLNPDARGEVYAFDLGQYPEQAAFTEARRQPVVSMDGHLLQLAQWPNRGYLEIDEILDEGPSTRHLKPGVKPPAYSVENPSGGKFTFNKKLSPMVAAEFERTGKMQVQGYLHNDWYFQNETVGAIDRQAVQLLRHTRYGIKNGIKSLPRRVKLVNVLSELDEPGEWYFDESSKALFIWPIPGFGKDSTLTVPGGRALISLRNTAYLTFRNFILENTGDVAFEIDGGHHNLLADSTVRNGVRRGAEIKGGHHNGISGCDFHDLENAFTISGGNLASLERCYNFATNNEIHHCRRRGYGVVRLTGVGIRFAHNLLYEMNGAVSFSAVDLLMEFNEFYHIGYEMGDFNVGYTGAQWWTMGNVIRYNFVHHLLEPGGHPISPFRNDDGGAGLNIFGNVFYRTGRCAGQFHGPANTLENNIAMEVPLFWWTSKKPTKEADIEKSWKTLERFGKDFRQGDKGDYLYIAERKIGPKFWEKSPWKEEYPELGKFIRTNPWAQTFCRVDRNYAYDVKSAFHIHGSDGTVFGMEGKKKGTPQDLPKTGVFNTPKEIKLRAFNDPKVLDFSLRSSFKPMKNFVPIPFSKIGLVKDAYRSEAPVKDDYRKKVYQRFKNDRTRGYDAKRVNARYPEPSYLRKSS